MGGILGQIETRKSVDPAAFARMLATLSARGPDGSGTRVLRQGRVALGHRRLAILDLSEHASQPMTNEDGTLWLTFNGEISNFRELRKQLEAQGHVFRSTGDSEVILHAYEEWGDDCLLRLRGSFAFGLWDDSRERLLLARDRLGVKPLYYHAHADGIVFASQPRAILELPGFAREVDARALHNYLVYGCVPGDLAIWAGMNKLPAAHRLVFDRRGLRRERYWEVRYDPHLRNPREAARLVRDSLDQAVRRQLASDQPLGVFLSGGIDSSTTAAIATHVLERRLPSFTLGSHDEACDKRPDARITSQFLRTLAHEDVLTPEAAVALIPDFIALHDEPFFDLASLSTLALSQLAKRSGVKVILTGDGADELFAGHRWYASEPGQRTPAWRRLLKRAHATAPELLGAHLAERSPLAAGAASELLGAGASIDPLRWLQRLDDPTAPRVTRLQLADLRTLLVDDVLLRLDHASMACGVELRVPFLDHELVEAVFSIESSVVFAQDERKALLKRAAASWLPPEILADRQRSAGSPLDGWLQTESSELAPRLLRDGVLVSRGLLRGEAVANLLASQDASARWLLLSVELWARHWLEPASPALAELLAPQATRQTAAVA
jgi:asparagine synthase (glutamine-hydrolysing)